jgi:uncharacterized membrane protein YphA (DoxX/SURF4 family)
MLGSVFLVSGARALVQPDPLVPAAEPVTDRLAPLAGRARPGASRGEPVPTRSLVQLNAAAHVVGGALMVTRFARPAALILAGTLVPTTAAGHAFWRSPDPGSRRTQQTQFLKNLGLAGGLLLAAMDTGGRPSLRRRAAYRIAAVNRSWRTATSKARLAARAANFGRRLPG